METLPCGTRAGFSLFNEVLLTSHPRASGSFLAENGGLQAGCASVSLQHGADPTVNRPQTTWAAKLGTALPSLSGSVRALSQWEKFQLMISYCCSVRSGEGSSRSCGGGQSLPLSALVSFLHGVPRPTPHLLSFSIVSPPDA